MDDTGRINMLCVWPIGVTATAQERMLTGDVAVCDLEEHTVRLSRAGQELSSRQVLVLIEGDVEENDSMEFGVLENGYTIIARAKRK